MQLNVVVEQRFVATPDRVIWTTGGGPYSFWERYLNVFDKVRVLGRVQHVDKVRGDWKKVEGPGVSVAALPHYIGPFGYMLKRQAIRRKLRTAIDSGNAVILRVPSPIGSLATKLLDSRKQPYSVEVVGDPYDVLSPDAMRHPLRPFLRWKLPRDLRRLVGQSMAASYVTEHALQKRYPIGKSEFSTHYSSIALPHHAIAKNARTYETSPSGRFQLVSVGTLHQMYKAPDVAIAAVEQCVKNGVDLNLVWVGDGKYRPEVEELARNTGCSDRFHFTGQLSQASVVREKLDRADIFILVSRTEGLPRAVVEAMARGLPCIGSTAGGIPELLPAECLVPPNDVEALAAKIADYCRNPKWMEAMSQRNLRKAQEYGDEVLSKRRTKFYQHVRETTERYLKEAG